jgi:hypothetical protein
MAPGGGGFAGLAGLGELVDRCRERLDGDLQAGGFPGVGAGPAGQRSVIRSSSGGQAAAPTRDAAAFSSALIRSQRSR